MPHRPAAPCTTPGCPELQPCPSHARTPWAGSTRNARLPDNWADTQARILERDQHRCQAAIHVHRCDGTATEVDHIVRGDDHRDTNLRAINHWCHLTKSGREGAQARWGGVAG